jgi:hypothetical protein
VLLVAAMLAACGKDPVQDITSAAPGASIKFFNFGVNAPNVNFYAGPTKLTAISSTTGAEATTGVAYGSVGNGGFYSGVTPGQYTFTGNIVGATDNGVVASSVSATVADGKSYSYYISGFYNTTSKTAEAFIIEDPFSTTIDFTVAYVRFVNAISNSSPMTMYAKNTLTGVEVPVGGAIAYKSGGAFTALPGGVYDLNTRTAGSSTNVITRTAVSFSAGRIYTISARGDITVVSTTATNRPFLDNTTNR